MVASTSTATVRPTANILTSTSGDSRKAANTLIMMSAADVITRAVAASPSTTLLVAVAGAHELLTHPAEQEHLVVHRQPEQDGEHDHRQERADRHGRARRRSGSLPQPHWKTATTTP